jgi:hypothetical protein
VWIWEFYMEPEKHRRKLLHVTLHKFAPKFNQATVWIHLNFNVILLYNTTLKAKTGGKIAADVERQIFYPCLFPLCPLCVCLPLASFPSTPAPNSTMQHCYTTFIMLISWSRGRLGQLQKCTFSLPKWVQNTHRAPHSPPECRISSKRQWFRYNIKHLAFRWGIGGFGSGG